MALATPEISISGRPLFPSNREFRYGAGTYTCTPEDLQYKDKNFFAAYFASTHFAGHLFVVTKDDQLCIDEARRGIEEIHHSDIAASQVKDPASLDVHAKTPSVVTAGMVHIDRDRSILGINNVSGSYIPTLPAAIANAVLKFVATGLNEYIDTAKLTLEINFTYKAPTPDKPYDIKTRNVTEYFTEFLAYTPSQAERAYVDGVGDRFILPGFVLAAPPPSVSVTTSTVLSSLIANHHEIEIIPDFYEIKALIDTLSTAREKIVAFKELIHRRGDVPDNIKYAAFAQLFMQERPIDKGADISLLNSMVMDELDSGYREALLRSPSCISFSPALLAAAALNEDHPKCSWNKRNFFGSIVPRSTVLAAVHEAMRQQAEAKSSVAISKGVVDSAVADGAGAMKVVPPPGPFSVSALEMLDSPVVGKADSTPVSERC